MFFGFEMDNVSCIRANLLLVHLSQCSVKVWCPASPDWYYVKQTHNPETNQVSVSKTGKSVFYCSGKQNPISSMDSIVCAKLQNMVIKPGYQDQYQKIIAAR